MKRKAAIALIVLSITNRIPLVGALLTLACFGVLAVMLIRRTPNIRLRWIAAAFLVVPYLPDTPAAFVGIWVIGALIDRLNATRRARAAKQAQGQTR
jgi:hypothetical protein